MTLPVQIPTCWRKGLLLSDLSEHGQVWTGVGSPVLSKGVLQTSWEPRAGSSRSVHLG